MLGTGIFGMKRKWKKRKDGDKDYPGQPETAPMHEIHDLIVSADLKIHQDRQFDDAPWSL